MKPQVLSLALDIANDHATYEVNSDETGLIHSHLGLVIPSWASICRRYNDRLSLATELIAADRRIRDLEEALSGITERRYTASDQSMDELLDRCERVLVP